MKPHTFTGELRKDSDSDWHYIHVPKEIRDDYKSIEQRGTIHVTATIGSSTWESSQLPWADGSAQLSVNAKIRKAEKLIAGNSLTVTLTPRP